jgi:hypothetical protein
MIHIKRGCGVKQVCIGFSRPKNWKPYAEAIMWVDKSNYDHCYLEFLNSDWGVSLIYQSSGLRTNFMGEEYFDSINIEVEKYEMNLPDDVINKLGKLCVQREGRPYGVVEVIGKALVILAFLIFRKKIKNPFKTSDTDCITEVSVLISQGLGIDVPIDMQTVTVKPFRDWIASLPNIREI